MAAVKIDNADDALRMSFIRNDFFEKMEKKIKDIIEEYRL